MSKTLLTAIAWIVRIIGLTVITIVILFAAILFTALVWEIKDPLAAFGMMLKLLGGVTGILAAIGLFAWATAHLDR